jgi:hypothetical protein
MLEGVVGSSDVVTVFQSLIVASIYRSTPDHLHFSKGLIADIRTSENAFDASYRIDTKWKLMKF